MFFFKTECPNCGNIESFPVYQVLERRVLTRQQAKKVAPAVQTRVIQHGDIMQAYGTGACPTCWQPLLFVFSCPYSDLEEIRKCTGPDKRYTGPTPNLLKQYPEPERAFEHPAIPEKTAKLFTNLQDHMRQNLDPSMVIAGCRSVLETAVNDLGAEGGTLVKRITDLQQKGVLPRVLADWAHQIRIEGNEAIHEINATVEQADEMINFVRIFLEYTFVLPRRIEEKRSR